MEAVGLISGEHVAVTVSDDDYESAILKAMHRFKEFVPASRVCREEDDDAPESYGAQEKWFVASTQGAVSAGGAQIIVTVVFKRTTR